mmetsp:Transcript_28611/g.46032  ORF Transcript_28611/g.46032 Transcript_28611/m.46032 type:complete len:263 (+) Transcript_28611:39-827(+)
MSFRQRGAQLNGHPPNGGLPPNSPPPALSANLPDPDAIARQKEVVLEMLDEQLKQGMSVLEQHIKYQREYLQVEREQQTKQFLLQLDQQMNAQDMKLTQHYNEQMMALQLQAGQQKAALEQQAMQLSLEYERRRAEESMYRQQYDIQRQQMQLVSKMTEDYQRMGALGSATPSYSPPLPGSPNNPPWAARPGEQHASYYRSSEPVLPSIGSYRPPPLGTSYRPDVYRQGAMSSALAPVGSYRQDNFTPVSHRHIPVVRAELL